MLVVAVLRDRPDLSLGETDALGNGQSPWPWSFGFSDLLNGHETVRGAASDAPVQRDPRLAVAGIVFASDAANLNGHRVDLVPGSRGRIALRRFCSLL